MKTQGKVWTPKHKISRKGRFKCHSLQNYFITLLICSSYHPRLLRKQRNGFPFPLSSKLCCYYPISIIDGNIEPFILDIEPFIFCCCFSAILSKDLEETNLLLTVLEINVCTSFRVNYVYTCRLDGVRARSGNRDIGTHTYSHTFLLSHCLHRAHSADTRCPDVFGSLKWQAWKNQFFVFIWNMYFAKVKILFPCRQNHKAKAF